MKAARIHGPRDVKYDTVEDPRIQNERDIILKVTATAICGSDLHIYSGGIPQPRPMTLGHEFMGIVEETGAAVTNLKRGDRVVVPFPIACGTCFFATTICLVSAKTATLRNMVRKAACWTKRAAHFSVILICMVDTKGDRRNMCEFPMRITDPGSFRII